MCSCILRPHFLGMSVGHRWACERRTISMMLAVSKTGRTAVAPAAAGGPRGTGGKGGGESVVVAALGG